MSQAWIGLKEKKKLTVASIWIRDFTLISGENMLSNKGPKDEQGKTIDLVREGKEDYGTFLSGLYLHKELSATGDDTKGRVKGATPTHLRITKGERPEGGQ